MLTRHRSAHGWIWRILLLILPLLLLASQAARPRDPLDRAATPVSAIGSAR